MVLSACLLKSHIKGKGSLWCGSRAAAAAALQWQAVDEACPPPPALTLRLPAPPRRQWQVRLEETIPVYPRGERRRRRAGMQSREAAHSRSSSSDIQQHEAPFQRVVEDGENTPKTLYQIAVNISLSSFRTRVIKETVILSSINKYQCN